MDIDIFSEANKIWSRAAKCAAEAELHFSIEIHKKLLSFFQVGDYYYYIFNLSTTSFDLVSSEVQQVLGYRAEDVTVPLILNSIHPDDRDWFLKFEAKVAEFFATLTNEQIPKYKVRYDYRLRRKDGTYIRILQQVVTIQSGTNKSLLRTFGVHTDITPFKKEGRPTLSFIGMGGEPSYHNVQVQKALEHTTILTGREREILNLVITGKKSDEISRLLFISKQTVDTHRKNLLKKTRSKNTATLITKAVSERWV